MIRSVLNFLDLPNWRDLPGGGLVSEVITDNKTKAVSGSKFFAFNTFLLTAWILVRRELKLPEGVSESMFFGFIGIWTGHALVSKGIRAASAKSAEPKAE